MLKSTLCTTFDLLYTRKDTSKRPKNGFEVFFSMKNTKKSCKIREFVYIFVSQLKHHAYESRIRLSR